MICARPCSPHTAPIQANAKSWSKSVASASLAATAFVGVSDTSCMRLARRSFQAVMPIAMTDHRNAGRFSEKQIAGTTNTGIASDRLIIKSFPKCTRSLLLHDPVRGPVPHFVKLAFECIEVFGLGRKPQRIILKPLRSDRPVRAAFTQCARVIRAVDAIVLLVHQLLRQTAFDANVNVGHTPEKIGGARVTAMGVGLFRLKLFLIAVDPDDRTVRRKMLENLR